MHQGVRLVDDLPDVGAMARGRPPLQRRPVVLMKAVEQALEETRPILEAHGQDPIVRCGDAGLAVDGDPAHLAQILHDLLSNCVKHTEPGGTISLAVERDGEHAVISVSDSGIGTPPDYLEDVFGVSAYRSGMEAGRTFTVRLPAIANPVSVLKASRATEPAINGIKGRRILVVDDNGDAAAFLAVLLELEGHEVQTAGDGGEAVDRAELFRPDVVVMDLDMPGIDGLEASRRIRARPWGSTILIAAMTGWGQEVDQRRAQEAGVDLQFVKPVDTTTLLGAVARALNDRRHVDLP